MITYLAQFEFTRQGLKLIICLARTNIELFQLPSLMECMVSTFVKDKVVLSILIWREF